MSVAFYLSDPTRDVKMLYEEMKNTIAEVNQQ